MAIVKPFVCIRPVEALAAQVAALPYDVYNRKEAREAVKDHPLLKYGSSGDTVPG